MKESDVASWVRRTSSAVMQMPFCPSLDITKDPVKGVSIVEDIPA
jgi:hypothetical protein